MRFLMFVYFIVSSADCLKILALFPYGGKSHVDVFLPLTKALAVKGHQVTVISHFPLKTPMANYTDINLSGKTFVEAIQLEAFDQSRKSMFLMPVFLRQFAQHFCKINYESPALQDFLNSNQKFDLIIAEYFQSDCFAGIVHKLQAPVIGISSCTVMPWMHERFGNPTNPSYLPNNFFDFSDRMSFWERVTNFMAQATHVIYYTYWMSADDYQISQKHFENLPPLNSIVFKSSLFLVNSHFTYTLPRPLVPSVIEVGGIHIGKVKKVPNVSNCFNFSIIYQYNIIDIYYISIALN